MTLMITLGDVIGLVIFGLFLAMIGLILFLDWIEGVSSRRKAKRLNEGAGK